MAALGRDVAPEVERLARALPRGVRRPPQAVLVIAAKLARNPMRLREEADVVELLRDGRVEPAAARAFLERVAPPAHVRATFERLAAVARAERPKVRPRYPARPRG